MDSKDVSVSSVDEEPKTTSPHTLSKFHIIDSQEIQYDMINGSKVLVGKGAFGEVFRGKYRGNDVALKELRSFFGPHVESLNREAEIMSNLHQENILPFLGLCKKPPLLVTPYMPYGNLAKYISNHKLSTARKLEIARGIALGMFWLAKKGIVHLDLKPGNIMISGDEVAKIADFGFSGFVKEFNNNNNLEHMPCGTPHYSAPELLKKDPTRISEKTDVFSYGMCLWQLFNPDNKYPWQDEINNEKRVRDIVFEQVVKLRKRPPIPQNIPLTLQKLIEKCWAHEPNDRPTFEQILKCLDDISVTEFVEDGNGRSFWKRHFLGKFKVLCEEFAAHLGEDFCLKEIIKVNSPKYNILHRIFTDDGKGDKVTLEKFGRLLTWFRPFSKEIVELMLKLYENDGFYGILSRDNAEKELNAAGANHFLLRLSESNPGRLTISVKLQNAVKHLVADITEKGILKFEDKTMTLEDLLCSLDEKYRRVSNSRQSNAQNRTYDKEVSSIL